MKAFWCNEREVPAEIAGLLEIEGVPEDLRNEILLAIDEVARQGAVTYPTRARVEYYLHKHLEKLKDLVTSHFSYGEDQDC